MPDDADGAPAAAPPPSLLRTLLARAVNRPPFAEPLVPERLRGFWLLVRACALVALAIDAGLWLSLHDNPTIDRRTLDGFVAINVPLLAGTYLLARRAADWQVPRRAVVVASVLVAQFTIVVWIQATGTLSSYFLVAGAMLMAAHRSLLSWTVGLISLSALFGMHAGAFVLEELGVLAREPLFVAEPGPVYDAAAMRWSILASIASIYGLSWMGVNLLVWTLRRTESALASAERRLAAAADGARAGRLTGRRAGGYQLLELIGRGGMAEVYRGLRERDGLACAVKVVHPHLVDDDGLMARVRQEAEIAARLPSSVTAAVLDVQLAGPGERMVVLDYLEGEDLAALLRRRRRLPATEANELLAAICAAVEVVHAHGIVHRDLKPHNLFVVDGGASVRVLDFGVARIEDDDRTRTRAAVVLGTPGYIAPEMLLSGSTAVGPEADLFALGVIAYQLLTGERPFPPDEPATGRTPAPLPTLVPELPAEVDAVIALALARAPELRYRRARDLAADLAAAMSGRLPAEVVRRARTARQRALPLDDTAVSGPGGAA